MRTYTADEVDEMIGRALAREREQRKPLTDEQIQYAFRTNSVVINDGNAYMVAGKRAINIARAIEAAHGIHAAEQLKGDA